MRILHIVNDVTNRGNGMVNAAVDIAIEQARQGNTVAIVSAGGEYEALLKENGVEHISLDQTRSPLNLLRAIFGFRRAVKCFHPQIVHAHMPTGMLLAWFWRRWRGYGLVSHLHNVHERKSKTMGLAQRVVVISDSVGQTMQQRGIPAKKIRVVLNRILGTARLQPLAETTPAMLHHPAIVTICGLNYRKGVTELIQAFELIAPEFSAAHLYIVGDGPEAAVFHQQAAASPVAARIHFEGFQSDVQSYLLATDVFVLVSRSEAFGLVLIEARNAGCPIIATDVDGIPQVLDYGRAGLLVPPQDPDALAAAIRAMLSDDAARSDWGKRAQQGTEEFTIARLVQELNTVYAEVLPGTN